MKTTTIFGKERQYCENQSYPNYPHSTKERILEDDDSSDDEERLLEEDLEPEVLV